MGDELCADSGDAAVADLEVPDPLQAHQLDGAADELRGLEQDQAAPPFQAAGGPDQNKLGLM